MARIIFVRHPETEWNAKNRIASRTDTAISQKGLKQAEKVVKALEKEPISAVYSSPLSRAKYLAEKIAENHGLKIVFEPVLKEADHGDFEGKPHDEYYDWWAKAAKQGSYPRVPGGEDYGEKEKKLEKFFEEIIEKCGGKTIAVVSHATTLRLVFRKWLGHEKARFNEIRIGNASISVWDSEAGKFEKFADVAHLK